MTSARAGLIRLGMPALVGALAVVALGFLLVAFVTWTHGRVTGRQIRGWQHQRWSATVTLVLVTIWFVVRNLRFAPFTSLYV